MSTKVPYTYYIKYPIYVNHGTLSPKHPLFFYSTISLVDIFNSLGIFYLTPMLKWHFFLNVADCEEK